MHGLNPCVVGLRFAYFFLLHLLNLLLGLLILSGFQILCIMVQGSLSIGVEDRNIIWRGKKSARL